MHKLFGTDGIRGTPGKYPLTDEMLQKLACAFSRSILEGKSTHEKARIVIGKDTRLSGDSIEQLLSESINKCGADVLIAGTITTPGLSYLVKETGSDLGIMISASHNKASDNGIKCFNEKGFKLLPAEELKVEGYVFDQSPRQATKRRIGKIIQLKDVRDKYVDFLVSSVEGLRLDGLRIALDCACGAASLYAHSLFKKLGAEIFSINDRPSGETINEGGAINPQVLKELVMRCKADIGIALDGDGDRGVLVDDKGHILDGDYILAIVAKHFLNRKKLPKNTLVTTVMGNYGLKAAIEQSGGKVIVTQVGDKHVLEALLKHELNLGGEQSGHIIFFDYLSSPDGMLTALQVLKVMKHDKKTLSKLAECMSKFPQVLVNVKVRERKPFELMETLNRKLDAFIKTLKDDGRVLLRYSGTELLARVMVEGKDRRLIEDIAESLATEIRQEIGIE